MRSYIIISAIFFLFSLSSTALPILNEGRVVITGQILNAKTKTISVFSEELTGRETYTIKLDEEGKFYLSIDMLSAHDNSLFYNNKVVIFYTDPGDSIYIEADDTNFNKAIKFSGQKAKFNESLHIFFSDFINFFRKSNYYGHQENSSPYDFIAVTNDLKNHLNKKIDSISRHMNPEKAAIDWMNSYVKYKAAEELFQFGKYHKDELPPDYYDFVNDLEEQKIEDLKCSQYYGDFIREYKQYRISGSQDEFTEVGNFISRGDTIAGLSKNLTYIDNIISNQIPKELILSTTFYRYINDYPNTIETLYPEYSKLVNNMEYQRFIKQQIDKKKYDSEETKTIDDLIDLEFIGKIFSEIKEKHNNKVIYIDLWGTWCKACIMQFPFSNELHESLKSEPIEFVYLCCRSSKIKWEEGIKKYNLQGTHYLLTQDQYSTFSSEFNFTGLPRYMIIDKIGNIVNDNAQGPNNENLMSELLELVD